MKQDSTDITIVLDRSGSMSAVKDDTIGGFNTFVEGQKKVPGEARLTLVQFDHEYEFVHTGKPIADIPALDGSTFVPRGNTALLDAIGRALGETGKRLSDIPEQDRPAHVIFVIITDGQENASREFSHAKVMELIKHQTEIYKWHFVFLGANQNAIATGASMGISGANSMTYAANSVGTQRSYMSLNANTAKLRTGQAKDMSWTADDRKEQKAAGASS